MLESVFSKVAGPETCLPMNFAKLKDTFFTEQLRWLLLIILDYIISYQTRKAHPLTRRTTLTNLICIFP